MGTSTSSRGPGAGRDIPFIPPWVDNPPSVVPPTQPPTNPQVPAGPSLPVQPPTPSVTPSPPPQLPSEPQRWKGARTSLGKFAKGGADRDKHLCQGLGHYTRSGMGGSKNAARRMRGSAKAAGSLHSALTALAEGQPLPSELGIDFQALSGRTPSEIADILVDAIRPIDGTQDAEATRDSAARALADILAQHNDLTNLSPEQIDQVTASTLGYDVAHRIELDVGKAIIDKAPSKREGLDRLQEMKDYVREVVAAQYAVERGLHAKVGRAVIERISREAIQQTFDVFEEFLAS